MTAIYIYNYNLTGIYQTIATIRPLINDRWFKTVLFKSLYNYTVT